MSASDTSAAVSAGVFLFAESSPKIVSLRSPGSHPHLTKRQGSGNQPQSTPHRVREKPRHSATDRRTLTTLLNTLPPVPVTSPRYSERHARSSTSRRYSASSTKGPPSHSGWLSMTSRYELCRTSVSARRSRSSFSRFTQLQSVLGGL